MLARFEGLHLENIRCELYALHHSGPGVVSALVAATALAIISHIAVCSFRHVQLAELRWRPDTLFRFFLFHNVLNPVLENRQLNLFRYAMYISFMKIATEKLRRQHHSREYSRHQFVI